MASDEFNSAALQKLSQLVIKGEFEEVKLLATRELVTATDEARRTVLMLVADTPETPVQTEKCILYLLQLGADPRAADQAGDTAAHVAARRGHLRLLALLSFDAKWLQNNRGATPLMEAARTGSETCAKHLLHLLRQSKFNDCRKLGNSERERLLELMDHRGRTAYELALLSWHSGLALCIEREMRLVVDAVGRISGLTAEETDLRVLKKQRADFGSDASCIPDRLGFTVFMSRLTGLNSSDCYSCTDESFQKCRTDPTCADAVSRSYLHYAARYCCPGVVSWLLNAGASVNARDWSEATPLMLSAKSNFTAVSCCVPSVPDPPCISHDDAIAFARAHGHNKPVHPELLQDDCDLAALGIQENSSTYYIANYLAAVMDPEHIGSVRLICQYSIRLNNLFNHNLKTAAQSRNREALVSRLAYCLIVADQRQKKSEALEIARAAAPAAVGRALLAAGADWTLKDEFGRTALDFATEAGNSQLAELLRQYEGKAYFDA